MTDGAGAIAECVVTAVAQDVVELRVLARHAEPAPEPRIVVVQAIPKGDRAELAVELMTEVGADVVLPWQAERCVVQWRGDRMAKALERWRRAAREAAKQSRRRRFPAVPGPVTLPEVAARAAAASLAIILDPEAPTALQRLRLPSRGEIVVIVGPEGGVSAAEAAGRAARADHHAALNSRRGSDRRAAGRGRPLGLASTVGSESAVASGQAILSGQAIPSGPAGPA